MNTIYQKTWTKINELRIINVENLSSSVFIYLFQEIGDEAEEFWG